MDNNNQYTVMAPFYDHLLRHVDYNQWYEYIKTIMYTYTKQKDKILEIGTGTGKFGSRFSSDNIEIYGMDLSVDMLKIASQRAYNNYKIFAADARNFYLKDSFSFIFAVHDTLNYITNLEEMEKVFNNVKSIMREDSIFMFDITTEYNIRRYFHLQSETFKTKDHTIVWGNRYDAENRIIYSTIKVIDKFSKSKTETHVQKIYTVDEISSLLDKCGFEIIDVFGDYTFEAYNDSTVMINFITRRSK